jgi:hypothetical protein
MNESEFLSAMEASDSKNINEAHIVCEAMQRFGGSFVQNLGRALAHADSVNTVRIKHAFPDYWNEYLELGRRKNHHELNKTS